MSIRPYVKVVFGVSDGKPESFAERDDFEELKIADWFAFGGEKYVSELTYIGSDEYNVSGIYGYVVDSSGDNDALRGLMLCFPEMFGANDTTAEGWKEFPIFYDEQLRGMYRRRDPKPDDLFDEIPDNQMYVGGYSGYIGQYRRAARLLFEAAEWTCELDKMKLMIVWGWK